MPTNKINPQKALDPDYICLCGEVYEVWVKNCPYCGRTQAESDTETHDGLIEWIERTKDKTYPETDDGLPF